ncbi:Carbon-nitrogen hydrolase domain protein [Acididesulfobacillus acetoxydans]|uniref:Carbon-nitrogen hydrolase domain protein n=1 Tax=Acididesulfobacillus acetoxydans TaxID=1561005 RepID=A0A8S0WQJ5_9FIRM|nr:nitrilase-related carbon-nitrogen hydrolase [Acididesulfobacillus acetoxydans]CAA7602664.1 Carbon-nitrogen hydrolase domain protein [Acididesulfobacillus acetoxydans]CEJ09137.1 Nitrilase/cyanide hydratase and apolipoprotein N-acyltransferase [Acididesulfobacillus acetoxydans]
MKSKFLLKILQKHLGKKGDAARIRSYIRSKNIVNSGNLSSVDPKKIVVAVVQEEIAIMQNYKEYVDMMYGFTKEAADRGAQLISFPEENGTLVLGMLPFIKLILKIMQINKDKADVKNTLENKAVSNTEAAHQSRHDAQKKNTGIDPAYIFSFLTPFISSVFETTFSELARSFGIYIMAGSVIIEDKGKLVNRAYLFGPDGEVVGTQDKAHLVELEMDLGLAAADRLQVFDTKVGKVAFPVCMDATYFETFKILKQQGAQIVIIPIANMEDYNYYLALRGIWPRVQESAVYGLKSSLVGELYGIKFTGKAGLFAPLRLTPARDGVIAEAASFDRSELICASINLTLLDSYSDPYFSDQNPELYKKYLPYVYEL